MFEYKNYESVIPKQEIDKLLRDLKAQNIHYGIFVSYKSHRQGKQCIDADAIDGKLIVYIAIWNRYITFDISRTIFIKIR